MKVSLMYPKARDMVWEDMINLVGFKTLISCLPQISEYYQERLHYPQVLHNFGVDIDPSDDYDQNVNCVLYSHGGEDRNASAKYYATDTQTGEPLQSTFCFKCMKSYTVFWFLYRMLKDRGKTLEETFKHIELHYGVHFPKHILLDFDPDDYYSVDNLMGSGEVSGIRQYISVRENATTPQELLVGIFQLYEKVS